MTIITHIGELVGIVPEGVPRKRGAGMDEVGTLKDAYLTIEGERISGFGNMSDCPPVGLQDEVIDAEGGMVMPTFCDSHTHICYAGTREQEFIDKINGLSYEEIAARGGGSQLRRPAPPHERGGIIFTDNGARTGDDRQGDRRDRDQERLRPDP